MTPQVTLTAANLKAHNHGEKVRRFFGCPLCKFFYWRTCFEFKPVTRCVKCSVKLDALPLEYEYGKGYYECQECDNQWSSPKCKRSTQQPCVECNTMYFPYKLGPFKVTGPRKSKRKHKCEHCVNGTCTIHPALIYSTIHDSTGSTISDVSSIFSMMSISRRRVN